MSRNQHLGRSDDRSALPMRVKSIHFEATDILSFMLQPLGEDKIGPIEPGSHVDIYLPGGISRSYSLSNRHLKNDSYRITVALDSQSSGGSKYIHESMGVGQVFQVSEPRNDFVLKQDAAETIFVAGGIGITPFIPMMSSLNALKKPWKLHYAVSSRDCAALLAEIGILAAEGEGSLDLYVSNEADSPRMDLAKIFEDASDETHLYCCGPTRMLDGFRDISQESGIGDRAHFEYFSSDVAVATEGGFIVELAQSKMEVVIAPGQTILDAVSVLGVDVPSSCEIGICGACETDVISGEPDHRDKILSEADRVENRSMMICCSGSKSHRLVLDL